MLEFLTGEARFYGWVFGKEISETLHIWPKFALNQLLQVK